MTGIVDIALRLKYAATGYPSQDEIVRRQSRPRNQDATPTPLTEQVRTSGLETAIPSCPSQSQIATCDGLAFADVRTDFRRFDTSK